MKRTLVILWVVILVASLSTTALAADPLVFSAESVTAAPGVWATVTLKVTQNPGFAGISLYPVVKDADGNQRNWKWQAEDANTEFLLADGSPFFDMVEGNMLVLYAAEDCTSTGTLLEISFLVPEDAHAGDYTVSFHVYDEECYDSTFRIISVTMPIVTITVGCGHENTREVAQQPASCTEPGYTAGIFCQECQTYLSGHEKIEATGHVEMTDEGTAPTCTQPGLSEGKRCSICHEILTAQEVVPALGHRYNSVVTAPTCTQKGFTTHTCDRCGDSYVDGHTATVAHSFGQWTVTKEASTEAEGEQTRQCACGQTESRSIPMIAEADDNHTLIIGLAVVGIAVIAATIFVLLKKKRA